MNTISYKGYLGTVNFSEKDGCFYGKIEGIDGLVNFEGESVRELTEAFHEAVDDYVAYCLEAGIEPHKSYSGQLNIRIKPETHSRIAALAKQTGESINKEKAKAKEQELPDIVVSLLGSTGGHLREDDLNGRKAYHNSKMHCNIIPQ